MAPVYSGHFLCFPWAALVDSLILHVHPPFYTLLVESSAQNVNT